jgi:uracil-DNA glycosylase family 4
MSKWSRLLRVYEEIEEDDFWDHLRQPGIHLVKGDGPASAEVARAMVVGEAPGASENGAGRPFVGASGEVLQQLMGLAGLTREQVFITNVVKYRPPGNRTPNGAEEYHAATALRREWMIVKPELTILVGATAYGAMHPNRGLLSMSASRNLGCPYEYRARHGERRGYVIAIHHPAWAMRGSKETKQARQEMIERDWQALGEWITEELPEVRNVALP